MPLRWSSSRFSPFLRNLLSSDDDDVDHDDGDVDDGEDDNDDYDEDDEDYGDDDDNDDYEPFQLCHWDTRGPGC